MIEIYDIKEAKDKAIITETILRQLPEWFGLEASILDYIDKVKDKLYFVAKEEDCIIGFIAIALNNQFTADIYVMGLLKAHQRKGIGKHLVKTVERHLIKEDFKMLMVKTLGASSNDLSYEKTRQFYKGLGFYPLEEFKEIWDKNNPCLIMAKSLEL